MLTSLIGSFGGGVPALTTTLGPSAGLMGAMVIGLLVVMAAVIVVAAYKARS